MTVVTDDGLQNKYDSFRGSALGDAWNAPSWLAGGLPSVTSGDFSSVAYGTNPSGAVHDALTFDTSSALEVGIYLTPYNGAHHGTYSIFLKMNDSTPVVTTDGIAVEFSITGSTGVYTGNVKSYNATTLTTAAMTGATDGTAEAGWLVALWTPGTTNLKVFWRGTQIFNGSITLGGSAGNRFGFGINTTVAGGICLVDQFNAVYSSTTNAMVRQRILVASSNGLLYKDSFLTTGMSQVSTTLTLASDRLLQAAEMAQKLYIADNGNPRITGSADSVSGTTFDHSGTADWTVYGITAADDVVVISNGTGTVTNGTYKISAVASGSITLSTSAGSGTCTYRIERAPKVYDPAAATLSIFTATAGQVPTGCPLITNWRNRIVMAGAPASPHVWYMSAQGTPTDFDYAATGSTRAVAGTASDAGTVGEPILALIDHSDDYLILGCQSSLWIFRGDPAFNGILNNLSRNIGVVGAKAWCTGPSGETIILSRDGLYMIPPGGGTPQSISREVMPRELLDIDPSRYTALLEYDPRDRGIHIYLTPPDANGQLHYWFDWQTKGFWPVRLTGTHEPTSIINHNHPYPEASAVLLGCRDGYIRRYHIANERDDGTAFSSYVLYGPVRLGGNYYNTGRVDELIARIAEDSGDVAWSVLTGDTAESAWDATATATGTFSRAGLNYKARPRRRDHSFYLKLANGETGRKWGVENMTAVIAKTGAQRRT